MAAPEPAPLAYRRKNAARMLDISVAQLDELLARGDIPSIKVGDARNSPRLIRHEALTAWLDQQEAAS